MFATMVLAALVVDRLFGVLGLIPSSRPSTQDVLGSIELNFRATLNAVGLISFTALFALFALFALTSGAARPIPSTA